MSSSTFSWMPIRSPFYLAGDARRKTDGVPNNLVAPPRSVTPSKVHPFSRFHAPFSDSSSLVVSSPSRIPSVHSLTHSHSVDIDSHPFKRPVVSDNTCIAPPSPFSPSDLTTSSNYVTNNSYHLRFASNLSRPLLSVPLPTPSSRAPVLPFSDFRPPVSAPDRLRAWTSPYSSRNRHHLESSLPQPLVSAAFRVAHDALAPGTRSTYAAGLLRFHQFCDSWGISEEARMPASEMVGSSHAEFDYILYKYFNTRFQYNYIT